MSDHDRLEAEVRQRCVSGDITGAVEATIRGLGPEVMGFLGAQHRREDEADEVFALWAERVWKGLAGFTWNSSLRTWVYVVARNTSRNYLRDHRPREKREVPLDAGGVSQAVAAVRTATRPYLRTESKDRLAALCATLPEDDRTLLVLRVDRQLAWGDIARVLLDEESPTDDALKRESQRLRKRFQLVKEKVYELGREAGLVDPDRERP
mgnify:CR=1 FL=1|jgi:RNA polymerase sigma-70 factor (ECF subfamily)